MKGMMIVKLLVVGVCILGATEAFASRANDDGKGRPEFASMKMDLRDQGIVRMEGNLLCQFNAVNTGAACELKLLSNNDGRTYIIGENDMKLEAMRLFHDGKNNVRVVGQLNNNFGNSLSLTHIEML